ncbi:MAG: response regulator [Saprospiraceae bacterium]|nr:response regulator [Saprospiraceae bacterium]
MSAQINHILVIEDLESDAEIIKAYLEEASFKHKLFHSDTLKGGINILDENSIDLVLLDLSINDSTGFNTLKKYLDESSHVPVVVMTGNKNEIVGIQSVKAGAQDFLVKGEFDSRRLVNTIRYSLQRFKTQAKLQKHAEELSITEKRRIEAQNMAKFANWEMDIVSNAMSWTEEMFRIFGVQPNSFQPSLSDYLDFVHVEDREQVEDFFAEVIKTGQLNRLEHKILLNNRLVKHLTIQARVNYDEFTNKIILIGSIQDTTYRLDEGETALPEPSVEPRPSVQNGEFYRFGFGIRTPFSSIVNLVYLLEKSNPTPQQSELIDGLKTSVDDLSIELNNMLNLSLLISDHVPLNEEDFSLTDMLETIQRVANLKAQQLEIPIIYQNEKELPTMAKGDAPKLSQLVHNLVEQCFSRSRVDGQVEFHVHWFKRKKDFPFVLKVQYDGEVLPSEDIVKERSRPVQDSAQSLQEAAADDSLSLSMIYRLVEILGAKLEVETQGKGTTVKLAVPLELGSEVEDASIQAPTQPKRILLVEDHVINQIATRKVLTSWSELLTVDIAADGEEAVDKFQNQSYDLVLMDLQMPKMDGLEATLKIRAQSKVPIVALTANSSRQEEEKCLGIGMNAYLVKPFKPEELYSKIAKFL